MGKECEQTRNFAEVNDSAKSRFSLRNFKSVPNVIRLKALLGRYGKTVQSIEAPFVAVGEEWCTVELKNRERSAARAADGKLVKTANA